MMTLGVRRDIVVIGGSAGALDPLKEIIGVLPSDLPAAVVVCLHLAATARSALAAIVNRAGALQAVRPEDGDPLKPGYIYVPTPDRHLEISAGVVRLTSGPKVNGVRPSVDVLFHSAADAYGPRVAGVVLSGGLDDGSAGLAAIKAAGGVGIVQSPDDALFDSMPRSALQTVAVDGALPARQIGPALVRAVLDDAHAAGRFERRRDLAGENARTLRRLLLDRSAGGVV
jgi:two-component system, chemotaxis family, protein-glutamate methylesterase/glutaminase